MVESDTTIEEYIRIQIKRFYEKHWKWICFLGVITCGNLVFLVLLPIISYLTGLSILQFPLSSAYKTYNGIITVRAISFIVGLGGVSYLVYYLNQMLKVPPELALSYSYDRITQFRRILIRNHTYALTTAFVILGDTISPSMYMALYYYGSPQVPIFGISWLVVIVSRLAVVLFIYWVFLEAMLLILRKELQIQSLWLTLLVTVYGLVRILLYFLFTI